MDVSCTIRLDEEDELLDKTPEQLAALVLAAVGGEPARDFCTVTVNALGNVGVQPGPPS